MNLSVIIPAAGSGTRIGGIITKQFLELMGKPIIIHSLEKFQNNHHVTEIIIATQKVYLEEIQKLCNRYNINKVKHIIEGGITRQQSIENCLTKINPNTELICVHDAVRPFISGNVINDAILTAKKFKAAVVAVPAKDTIKKVSKNKKIEETLNRDLLWIIQTPQIFNSKILIKAYKNAKKKNIIGTDDSSLVEAIGIKPKIVVGEYENIKITTKDDLDFAELILNKIK